MAAGTSSRNNCEVRDCTAGGMSENHDNINSPETQTTFRFLYERATFGGIPILISTECANELRNSPYRADNNPG